MRASHHPRQAAQLAPRHFRCGLRCRRSSASRLRGREANRIGTQWRSLSSRPLGIRRRPRLRRCLGDGLQSLQGKHFGHLHPRHYAISHPRFQRSIPGEWVSTSSQRCCYRGSSSALAAGTPRAWPPLDSWLPHGSAPAWTCAFGLELCCLSPRLPTLALVGCPRARSRCELFAALSSALPLLRVSRGCPLGCTLRPDYCHCGLCRKLSAAKRCSTAVCHGLGVRKRCGRGAAAQRGCARLHRLRVSVNGHCGALSYLTLFGRCHS